MELLHEFHLGVSYKRVHSIETSYARVTGTEAKANGDVICPNNLRYDIFSVADEIIIRRAVHICHTCRSKSNHQTNYNTTTLTHCVRKPEMNHFCQLCGRHIGLFGLMSLDSVKKVWKHSCVYSMRK